MDLKVITDPIYDEMLTSFIVFTDFCNLIDFTRRIHTNDSPKQVLSKCQSRKNPSGQGKKREIFFLVSS